MKKYFKTLCCVSLAVLMTLSLGVLALAEQMLEAPDTSKTVDSLEVYQMPEKTVYMIGDTFSAQGGVLKIIYTDGTAALIDMEDSSIKLSKPTMNTANSKNVTASYEKKRVVFKVEVVGAMYNVAFSLNYEGAPEATVAQISTGTKAEKPADPTREGYAFVAWYANSDYTHTYDFNTSVTGDMTLYAFWTKEGADYVNVTFDYDYYGVKLDRYTYPVEKDTQVLKPAVDPVRIGYTFENWVDESGTAFDFSKAITEETTIQAAWKKTVEGAETWVFEAEDTDLTGKIGPSYSGTAQEESMIIYNETIGASNNRMVGYLYEKGISLEFYIASDSDVTDAQIALRITGEFTTMGYDGNDFQVLVNDSAKNYAKVTLEVSSQDSVLPCEDLIVISGVALNKGANLIQLKTNNTNAIEGTTFKANAPIVDCIKITSSAVLIWDENHGVPALKNYQH